MATINARVVQQSSTTSAGYAREHKVLVDRPLAKEGTDQGPMGGELLLISLGGCFMSTLLEAMRSRSADVRNIEVAITATADGTPARFTAIDLAITADYSDEALMQKLVTIAERGCLVSNTLKGTVALHFHLEPRTAALL
jgi:putative redox protein